MLTHILDLSLVALPPERTSIKELFSDWYCKHLMYMILHCKIIPGNWHRAHSRHQKLNLPRSCQPMSTWCIQYSQLNTLWCHDTKMKLYPVPESVKSWKSMVRINLLLSCQGAKRNMHRKAKGKNPPPSSNQASPDDIFSGSKQKRGWQQRAVVGPSIERGVWTIGLS